MVCSLNQLDKGVTMFSPQPPLNELPKTLAYLDPGSGSFLIQMLIAAFLGGGILLKALWNRITGKKTEDDDINEGSTDSKENDR
jgi:hypothetical protein